MNLSSDKMTRQWLGIMEEVGKMNTVHHTVIIMMSLIQKVERIPSIFRTIANLQPAHSTGQQGKHVHNHKR